MKHTTNQRRPARIPCGWNHRRIFFALAPVALLVVARAIYIISK